MLSIEKRSFSSTTVEREEVNGLVNMSRSYPIWNKVTACIYKASKCYGIQSDGLSEFLIGTSKSNSHDFVKTRVTHKKCEDGTRTYYFFLDDKLYKKATLRKNDNEPFIEKVTVLKEK